MVQYFKKHLAYYEIQSTVFISQEIISILYMFKYGLISGKQSLNTEDTVYSYFISVLTDISMPSVLCFILSVH